MKRATAVTQDAGRWPARESPASPALSGEGQWTPVAGPDGRAVGYRTVVRPDALHTSELVGVLRLDQHRVGLRLFPGLKVPGDTAKERWSTATVSP